jgi:quinol monooxygenase YgiN
MITIVAKCSVKPSVTEEFLELALSLVHASRVEAGNVSYEFFRDLKNPALFTFIECWKDQESVNLHNSSEHFVEFGERAAPFFSGPLDIGLYQKLT